MFFLSIVVPVYNVEKYLKRCIDSLVNQDMSDKAEILLIDDGSTDSSGSICDGYSDRYENVKTIHKTNGGLSDARNCALDVACGKYVSFIDSDDLVADSYIRDMFEFINKHDPDLISYGYVFEKTADQYSFRGDKNLSVKTRDEMIDALMKNIIGNQVCFNLYRRELFDGIRFPVGRAYEDISTLYRILLKTDKSVCVNYTYYVYNITNSNSITKTTNIKNMNNMYTAVNEQCEALEKYYEKTGSDKEYLNYYKLDKYIYIYLKITREIGYNDETKDLIRELEERISKIRKCNLIRFRYYNLKKYLYYRLTHLFRR